MVPREIKPLIQVLYENRDYRFWACQVVGWAGYALVTFLSVTLIDDKVSWPHIGHICLSAVLGILCAQPLRSLYRQTFEYSLVPRLFVAAAAVVVVSGVWTALRVLVFAQLEGEEAVWDEVHYWYFGSLFVFLSWSVLYYGIKYYELLTLEHQKLLEESALKREEHLYRVRAESAARDAQLQMLRYQLNPHFLFNTLNAINALVKLRENDRAQEMIQYLSQFLRHTLEQDGVENVSLEQELDSLMLYLNIEKARFEDRLTLVFEIDCAARQASVPGLILQPILENAMKYAIGPSENGGTVRICAAVVGDKLHLEVSDDGPGMVDTSESATFAQGHGVGLSNTRKRLETLYGEEYSLEIGNGSPAGLTIKICIPYQPMYPAQVAYRDGIEAEQCIS
jgi:two-component system, LytTR family, sensor kinase